MKVYKILKRYSIKNKLIKSFVKNIDNGLIQIKKFSEFDNRTIWNVKKYLKKRKIKCTTSKNVIEKALILYDGWIYGNTIYYNDILDNNKLLETLIHEYVHFIRKKEKKFIYRSDENIFTEECIAELSSIYFMNKLTDCNYIFTNKFLEIFINEIILNYNLDVSITPFSLKNGTLFSKKNIIAPFQA